MMLQRLFNKLYLLFNRKYFCPVCNHKTKQFVPLPNYYKNNLDKYGYAFTFDDTETLNYRAYSCPHCGASDRDRLYAIFISKYLSEVDRPSISLLDIAPSASLSQYLKGTGKILLRTADLMMKGVDDNIDVTNMTCYADESFDFFICSHVLEHVTDDLKAMKELRRVLKLGGCGILMVPILLSLEQIDEDPLLEDVGERWRRFGQDDHVRMYSKNGFVQRAESAGFIVKQYGHDYFGSDVLETHGINNKSVLYVVE